MSTNNNSWILHNTIGNNINLLTNIDRERSANQKNGVSNKYALIKVESNIFKRLLFNELHKKFKFTIKRERIEKQLDILLENASEEIDIIPMVELSEEQVQTYLECFKDESDNLEKYAELLSIIKYEQVSPNSFRIKLKLERLLESQSNFWEDPFNCKYSLNDKFKKRRFNTIDFSGSNEILNIFKRNITDKLDSDSNSNYLNDIVRNTNWIDSNIKSYYFISNNSQMSNEMVNQIYDEIPSDYLKYSFICNLLITRTHCHLVINNKELLINAKPIFEKFQVIFKYLIGYTWLTLRNEETIIKTKIKDNDRFIFDIETAEHLPIYPFSYDNINLNPYACILLDNQLINLPNNCMSLNMMKDYKNYYGLCSREEFIRRLNIFVNGTNKSGILDLIDWNYCVVTGSAMTACAMKYNPLMDICKANLNEPLSDIDLSFYFLNYYAGSDIDMICNHKSIYDYIDYVDKFIIQMKNINSNIKLETVHTGTIIISDDLIAHELEGLIKVLGDKNTNIDYIKDNFNNIIIKTYFYQKYYSPWKDQQEQFIKSKQKDDLEVYQEYMKKIPIEEFRIYTLNYEIDEENCKSEDYEKYFYLNDISDLNKLNELNELNELNGQSSNLLNSSNKLVAKLSESIRYKVSSNETRTFEIFKSRDSNFFSIVSKFHMGFVRAYYNGLTLKCLPSFITSMMLQLSTDYKYFASIRDPIEIVNKYRSRGFGIVLNDHEKMHMVWYNGVSKPEKENKWIDIYNINIKNKASRESIFGAKSSSEEIFKPGKYFGGLPNDCFQIINHQTISDSYTAFSSFLNGKLDEFVWNKTINDQGFINPVDPTIIKVVWNKMM